MGTRRSEPEVLFSPPWPPALRRVTYRDFTLRSSTGLVVPDNGFPPCLKTLTISHCTNFRSIRAPGAHDIRAPQLRRLELSITRPCTGWLDLISIVELFPGLERLKIDVPGLRYLSANPPPALPAQHHSLKIIEIAEVSSVYP
jgi:hypothetical protein